MPSFASEGEASGSLNPFLIVAAEFVRTGGMDMANLALATYLADTGRELHLAAHRVDEALAARPDS